MMHVIVVEFFHGENKDLFILRMFQFNTMRLRKNYRHFANNIYKCIFLNKNARISNQISLKLVPMGPIDYMLTLAQIMAWHWTCDKPLSEPIMAGFTDAYMHDSASMS